MMRHYWRRSGGACLALILWVGDARGAEEPLLSCAAEPMDTSISYGDHLQCDIGAPADTDILRFAGSAGDRVTIFGLRTAGGDVCVNLRRPNGTSVGSVSNGCCGDNSALLNATLDATGTFAIIVGECGNNTTLGYRIFLDRFSPPPSTATDLCFGCEREDELNPAPDRDSATFEGSVGDLVRVVATRTGGGDICVTLRDSTGESLGSQCNGCCGDSDAVVEATLEESGTHSIDLSESNDDGIVNYRVGLQCITGSCTEPATPECNGETGTIVGTDGDNILTGTDDRDVIVARGGNDLIYGLGGDDLICGDAGNDLVFGGDGNDRILGGRGDDLLFGQGDNDRLTGSAGNDLLSGGGGDDNMNGGSGSDVCDGGPHVSGDSAAGNCDQKPGVP